MKYMKIGFILLELIFYLTFVSILSILSTSLLLMVYKYSFISVEKTNDYIQNFLAIDKIGQDLFMFDGIFYGQKNKSLTFMTKKFAIGWFEQNKKIFRIQDGRQSTKSLVLKDVNKFSYDFVKKNNAIKGVSIKIKAGNKLYEGFFAKRIGVIF